MWIAILCGVILIVGVVYLWKRKPKKFAQKIQPADVANGRIPPAWRDTLAQGEQALSDRMTLFYSTPEMVTAELFEIGKRLKEKGQLFPPGNDGHRFDLKPGERYQYTETFEQLVDRIEIVDGFPNSNALGTMSRSPATGVKTLTLTKRSMNDPQHLMHELGHALQWFHEELYGPLGYATPDAAYGTKTPNHWPYMYSDFLGD